MSEYRSDLSWYRNSVSLRATIGISSVKVSINNFFSAPDDSIVYFHPICETSMDLGGQNLSIRTLLFRIRTIFSRRTGCMFSSKNQSTIFRFSINLERETFFSALSGKLIDWKFRHLQRHMILREIPTYLSKTTDWTSSIKVSVDVFSVVMIFPEQSLIPKKNKKLRKKVMV